MDDLPELPFEKVLSYLSLEERLKARGISRRWYHKINSFRVQSLCYSDRPRGFIWGKRRLVSGAFAQNFIRSTRFASFFDTFGPTILSSLKRLRFCGLDLTEGDTTAFDRTLNSFGQLEELDIIRAKFEPQRQFKLNLPMLTSFQLENVRGIEKLILEAPRLREVTIRDCLQTPLRVEIVHGESVERLLADRLEYTEVKKLKNLKVLYIRVNPIESSDSTFLSSLHQLNEIHTNEPGSVLKLFEQKQRSGRVDLKIYVYGLLLNGPHDPAMHALRYSYCFYLSRELLVCLGENLSRLADQIPFCCSLYYSAIEKVAPGLEVDLLKRFTDLNEIFIDSPVQDTQRFLGLLKSCKNIVKFTFFGDQPQDLFDRLPEYCAVQSLFFDHAPSDLDFLFRLKHLIHLNIHCSIDIKTVRRAFEELPLLSWFAFKYGQVIALIRIGQSKQFEVSIPRLGKETTFSDLNPAIEFITEKEKSSRSKKRKAEDLM